MEHKIRWIRIPEKDKRIAWGDDYAGDAWKNRETGEIRWAAVGIVTWWDSDAVPNARYPRLYPLRERVQ